MADHTGTATRARGPVIALALSLATLLCALWVSNADAYTGINAFTMSSSSTQAGGHPDVDIHMNFDNRSVDHGVGGPYSPEDTCNCEDVAQIDNHFPTGFIGNPHAIGQCTLDEMSNSSCPTDAQVGMVEVSIVTFQIGQSPLYNMEPHPGEPGLLAFNIPLLNVPSFISLHGRTGSDYGLDASTVGIVHTIPVNDLLVHLWGVPGDAVHDINRLPSPQQPCGSHYPAPCPGAPVKFNGTPAPYLENPTSCGEQLTGGLDLYYYDHTHLHSDTPYPTTTGCDLLSFNPSMTVAPTTTQGDAASGLDLNLTVPQTQSPTVPAPSEIRAARITLPRGFSINTNAADGKVACTDEQASFGSERAAECPESAKVGSVILDSSALPGPIYGAMYLGNPLGGDRYPVILTADGFSTHVKLPGMVAADPQTGQLVTSFEDLPQSPFQEFDVHIFGSERGVLATPTRCGDYEVHSEFVPWDAVLPNQTSVSRFSIDSGPNGSPCPGVPRPFAPAVVAGGPDNTAGAHSPFTLSLTRADGEQNMAGLTVTTPPGFLATLRGIPYCPDSALATVGSPGYAGLSEIATPGCPIASQIGTTVAAAGAGSRPVYLGGKVYLAGPYKGAPLSLAVVTPAVSGPYDLGNVVVRAAVWVDSTTAQVTTVSDPLPQIYAGVPLRARFLRVDLNRPGFTLNPTNCDPFSIDVTTLGDEGATSTQRPLFQVANCADLPFAPRLGLRLSGGVNRRGHPSITAVVSSDKGEANPRRVSVTLPKGELLDNAHIGTVCTRVDFGRDSCPSGSLIGEAEVTSPLLDAPLTGSVYLRTSTHRLPDLVISLTGQIDLELAGRVDSVGGRLRTTFAHVPDAPFEAFTLRLAGGSKGLVTNSEDLCGASKRAMVAMTGQNGAISNTRVRLSAACRGAARHKRHHRAGRGR
jgi:hypothetical protein